MENYIYYCYKKWLKENEGSLRIQISKLDVVAIILLFSLLATLIGLFVILSFAIAGCNYQIWAYILMALEFILTIGLSIYCEKKQVSHSQKNLSNYISDCNNLKKFLSQNQITIKVIPKLVERYNSIICDIEEKIDRKHNSINKFMEIMLIPGSVLILGAMLDKEITVSETLGIGISGLLILFFIYGVILFGLFLYDVIMRIPENTYKQLVSDLQSILDFEECEFLNLLNDDSINVLIDNESDDGCDCHTKI